MPARSWKFHMGRLALGAAGVIALGLVTGEFLWVVSIALAIYLGWNLANGFRLYRWLHLRSDEPPESVGAWADIFDQIDTLQKQALQRETEYQSVIREFQGMTDAFPDATLVIDENDCITWFNDAAHQLLGLRVPEDLGQPVTNLLREPDFANWISVQERVQGHFEMTSPLDDQVHLSVSAVSFLENQRLLILKDVTDIHNLERVRRDFVANVSHELRTPLTVLLGYLESMGDHCSEDLEPAVRRMQEQARQMEALLNDLLELSRLQSDQHEPTEKDVDVPGVLAQLGEQAEELSQGNHKISLDIDPDLHLRGTRTDLESAFRNLINNAIQYTPDGGSIAVTWQETAEGPLFQVRDSGIGIPEKEIPRLTERFYRVGSDRSRLMGGTGLGLAIVKHVLNSHEARLLIDSELGEGSTFGCQFPPDRGITRQRSVNGESSP